MAKNKVNLDNLDIYILNLNEDDKKKYIKSNIHIIDTLFGGKSSLRDDGLGFLRRTMYAISGENSVGKSTLCLSKWC